MSLYTEGRRHLNNLPTKCKSPPSMHACRAYGFAHGDALAARMSLVFRAQWRPAGWELRRIMHASHYTIFFAPWPRRDPCMEQNCTNTITGLVIIQQDYVLLANWPLMPTSRAIIGQSVCFCLVQLWPRYWPAKIMLPALRTQGHVRVDDE